MYQRYGGDIVGVDDLAEELRESGEGDSKGIGFPLIPVFFPIQRKGISTPYTSENFSLS